MTGSLQASWTLTAYHTLELTGMLLLPAWRLHACFTVHSAGCENILLCIWRDLPLLSSSCHDQMVAGGLSQAFLRHMHIPLTLQIS